MSESLNNAGVISKIGTFFLFVCLFDKLDVKDLWRLHGFIIATLHVSSTWGITDKTEGVSDWQYWDDSFRRLGSVKTTRNSLTRDERTYTIMDADKQMFPGYYAFIEQLMAHLNANKVPAGEPRVHPLDPTQRWQPAIATWESPYGLTFGWETEPSPQFALDKGITESIKPTKAKNYSVQGTGSSANKCAGVAAFLYRAHHPEYRRVLPTASVHDANYWDIPADLVEPGVALLQASMMACNNVLQALGLNTRVAVPAVTTYGPCWKELEGDKTVDKDDPQVVQFISELTSKPFLKEIFK